METSPRKHESYKPSMKLIKSTVAKKKSEKISRHRLLINTLSPLFTYKNGQGIQVAPKRHVLL